MKYANAKVAQDIILRYLFKSEYKNHITFKCGVVMYNLTQDKRQATIYRFGFNKNIFSR